MMRYIDQYWIIYLTIYKDWNCIKPIYLTLLAQTKLNLEKCRKGRETQCLSLPMWTFSGNQKTRGHVGPKNVIVTKQYDILKNLTSIGFKETFLKDLLSFVCIHHLWISSFPNSKPNRKPVDPLYPTVLIAMNTPYYLHLASPKPKR